jgi:hypothetical protein
VRTAVVPLTARGGSRRPRRARELPDLPNRPFGAAPRRGAVLVMAIWVILILAALALVFRCAGCASS